MGGLQVTNNATSGTNQEVASFRTASGGGLVIRSSDLSSANPNSILEPFFGESLILRTAGNDRLKVQDNGDVSFYEDTGTTAKLFWDASAEKLDISGAGGLTAASITISGAITEDAVTLTGTATTIDLATATNFVHDLTGATTYTFSNPAATGNASSFTLKIIQDSTTRAITWPNTVDWAGGTAPTLTATDNGVDVFVFYTIDGGTTYYGFTAGQAMA